MLTAIKACFEKGIQWNIDFLAACEQNQEDDDLYQGGKSFEEFEMQFEDENPDFYWYGVCYIDYKFEKSNK